MLKSFLDLIAALFRLRPSPPPPPPDDPNYIVALRPQKVLLLIFDPQMPDGRPLSRSQNWYRPDDLIAQFRQHMLEVSYGVARFEIVERIELNEFPPKMDGFRYTPQMYLDVLRGVVPPHQPQEVDYQALVQRFDLLNRVARGEIDEVWVFAFPHAGFYESIMAGAGAYWCNAPPLRGTETCPRRFVIMGFSFERGVGEMFEAFGHRAESILEHTFEPLQGEANLWKRFTRYEKIAPGQAAVGTIHFAPNSEHDYDWGNPRPVWSECDDWRLNFPNFQGLKRLVSAADWGNGDLLLHHLWWFKHIPHVAGRKNGIFHNWWAYILLQEAG